MADIAKLQSLIDESAAGLSKITSKKMFGCHALWADGNVFALVWKHGRIGYKLPDAGAYDELMGKSGAEPWKAGPMTMTHWVLVPEAFHAKPAELKKWAGRAHALCSKLENKAAVKKNASAKAAPAKPAKAKKSAPARKKAK